VTLSAYARNGLGHEVHSAQNMMKTRMIGARVNEVTQAQLLNATQALKVRMLENIENNFVWQRNKTVNWVVYNFLLVIRGGIRWQDANFKNSIKAIKNKTYAR
jgi:hypothetical protein